MRYLWQHLEEILLAYDGRLPLHHFLKVYFKAHPKLGSRDRRGLSDAMYAWYRVGKALEDDENDLRLKRLAAMQLCGLRPKAFASFFPEDWPSDERDTDFKLEGFFIQSEKIFPYDITFSAGITIQDWRASILRQPRLFLRIRKDRIVIGKKLSEQNIPHEWIGESCLALPNGCKLERILPDDAYVVQDASSQATGAFLQSAGGVHWWDCCAGAGGKSLMLADAVEGINLLATDVRESILQNLAVRFRQYQLQTPERQVLDASDAANLATALGSRKFDGIICDVPCSGSGTWARTPEACYFFRPETLAAYAGRQRAILSNAVAYLSNEGKIVYITCSVFRAENEDIVESVATEKGLTIESSGLINGMAIGADSLFAAVLRKAQ